MGERETEYAKSKADYCSRVSRDRSSLAASMIGRQFDRKVNRPSQTTPSNVPQFQAFIDPGSWKSQQFHRPSTPNEELN